MKIIKLLCIPFFVMGFVNANDIFDNTQKNIFESKYKNADVKANKVKDSWLTPINLEADISKSKQLNSSSEIGSKKISIGFEQDIYKTGAILETIKKGKLEKILNTNVINQEKKSLLSSLYSYIIDLQKRDLEIKKLYYLISSKEIEIKKNEELFNNGIIDITVLDESIIELSDLKNQKENLNIEKIEISNSLSYYSTVDYKTFNLDFLVNVEESKFIIENINIRVKELQLKQSRHEEEITKSDYLPKVSVYGSVGYEDNDQQIEKDDYYNYGLKVSMPFDFNGNKNKQISKINSYIKDEELTQVILNEKRIYTSYNKKLHYINNKIANVKETIIRYQNLFNNISSLHKNDLKTIEDVAIMENRVKTSKLDKMILELDKKSILNILYSKI